MSPNSADADSSIDAAIFVFAFWTTASEVSVGGAGGVAGGAAGVAVVVAAAFCSGFSGGLLG